SFSTKLFELGPASAPLTGIAFSKPADGGGSWQPPVAAIEKDARTHFLDKDWSAVDPMNPDRILITYTDFDQSGTSGTPPCGFVAGRPILRTAIELVQSSGGGASWSRPPGLAQGCNAAPAVAGLAGVEVRVGKAGEVYV